MSHGNEGVKAMRIIQRTDWPQGILPQDERAAAVTRSVRRLGVEGQIAAPLLLVLSKPIYALGAPGAKE
jgi:hypothetical protein